MSPRHEFVLLPTGYLYRDCVLLARRRLLLRPPGRAAGSALKVNKKITLGTTGNGGEERPGITRHGTGENLDVAPLVATDHTIISDNRVG
ncbi:MAG: hypothetical protein JSU86_15555 [Phycisphaerales bacterium]|nr:MAG: hypothetical protein JSU86_15555 [Phycisphaerales bacterium]